MEIKIKQQLVKYWFSILQDIICLEVENLEKEYGSKIKFNKNKWICAEPISNSMEIPNNHLRWFMNMVRLI